MSPSTHNMPKKKATCDLCCNSLEKSQDVLQCEGECSCTVHRYCVGVTKRQFEELRKGSKPFICQWCSLTTVNFVIQQLQANNVALKLELCEVKRLLSAAKIKTASAALLMHPYLRAHN